MSLASPVPQRRESDCRREWQSYLELLFHDVLLKSHAALRVWRVDFSAGWECHFAFANFRHALDAEGNHLRTPVQSEDANCEASTWRRENNERRREDSRFTSATKSLPSSSLLFAGFGLCVKKTSPKELAAPPLPDLHRSSEAGSQQTRQWTSNNSVGSSVGFWGATLRF